MYWNVDMCVYVYSYICVHIFTQMNGYIYICIYIYAHTIVCVHTYRCVSNTWCVYIYILHIYIHALTYMLCSLPGAPISRHACAHAIRYMPMIARSIPKEVRCAQPKSKSKSKSKYKYKYIPISIFILIWTLT